LKINVVSKIQTDKAPLPNGHYAQATLCNGLIYTATQIGIDPKTNDMPSDLKSQTLNILNSIKVILEEAGSSLNKIMRITIYVQDISLWEEINTHYTNFMKDAKPARGVIPLNSKLHKGAQVAMEAIAVT
tara:strand:+ start:292 stop:681 length:390 start_codon:yes stop_codon:yes gene_type:complete